MSHNIELSGVPESPKNTRFIQTRLTFGSESQDVHSNDLLGGATNQWSWLETVRDKELLPIVHELY
jgi:hypothetical protein